jgi:hypothetical protein
VNDDVGVYPSPPTSDRHVGGTSVWYGRAPGTRRGHSTRVFPEYFKRYQRDSKRGERKAERERVFPTHRPLSLSSLSLIPLLNFLNSRFCLALSAWTRAIWRNQRRHERFSRRWPCSRWEATFVHTFQVRVSVSASLI